jgi:hypothetical protein
MFETDLGTFFGYEIGAQAKFDEKKPERQQGLHPLFRTVLLKPYSVYLWGT